MRTLKIGFSRPRSKWKVGSALIRLFERSDFSHTFLRWESESLERELVYQASHGMVHFMAGHRFDIEALTVREYEIQLTDSEFNLVLQKCVDLAGVKYGYWTLFGMAIERLTGCRNPFRDRERTYVCSELVGEVLKLHGDFEDLDLELIGPKVLESSLAELPGVVRTK